MKLIAVTASAILGFAMVCSSLAAESPAMSATDLAARLSELRENGSSYVRARMEIRGKAPETFQLQIKERRMKNSLEVVYQVLWPKERKGEAVLLRRLGDRPPSGMAFTPPGTMKPITNFSDPMLGSNLAYEDVIDNFFAWDQQTLAGTEKVDGVVCQILESKPGKSVHSSYGKIRSWIDPARLVPLRIEKYSAAGQLLRRIDTTRVTSDAGHVIPANLLITGASPDSATAIDGSKLRHDVTYTDAEFTAEGIKELSTPKGATE